MRIYLGASSSKKSFLSVPGGAAAVEKILTYRKQQLLKRFKSHSDVFTHHYKENFWGNEESRSGDGSSLKYTENIRMEIPRLIESLGIKSILDAPCGDYNWFQHIKRADDVHYTGGDIVAPVVSENNQRFGDHHTKFVVMDITADPLPDVDLWLCRDCLFHLPTRDVSRVLERFRKSNIRYLLTTTYPQVEENTDILVGDFRPINLTAAPFNLCPPQMVIEDWIPGSARRHLALWERSMLA